MAGQADDPMDDQTVTPTGDQSVHDLGIYLALRAELYWVQTMADGLVKNSDN